MCLSRVQEEKYVFWESYTNYSKHSTQPMYKYMISTFVVIQTQVIVNNFVTYGGNYLRCSCSGSVIHVLKIIECIIFFLFYHQFSSNLVIIFPSPLFPSLVFPPLPCYCCILTSKLVEINLLFGFGTVK